MRIVHRRETGDRVVELVLDDGCGTVGDVAAALSGAGAGELILDGQVLANDVPLSSVTICEGSILTTTPAAAPAQVPPTARALAVVGGVRAGVAHPLAIGARATIGRSDHAQIQVEDPTVSGRHLSLEGDRVRDHGSRNGTTIEGHPLPPGATVRLEPDRFLRLGATRLALRPAVDDCPVAIVAALGAVGGTIPFNRPPRSAPPVVPAVLTVPAEPTAPAPPEPLSVAGIVLPIIGGAVVALLLSPLFAVFAALGPILTIGTWWERRRRGRRDHRRALHELRVELDRLEVALPGLRDAEIARRRRVHPDPAEVVRRARQLSVRCWERRPGDPDSFRIGIGADDEPFAPALLGTDGQVPATDAVALVARQPAMPDVPIEIDLSPGHIVGVIGHRPAAIAVARSLVLQMVTHHGPADLAVAVGADDPGVWSWCTWLPHTVDHTTARRGAAVMSTGDVATASAILAVSGDRAVLAVIDGDDPFQGRSTVGRRLLIGDRTAAIVMVPDAHRLPGGCSTVIHVDALGRIEMVDPRRPGRGRRGLGWGVDASVAVAAARRLARLDDPELPLVGAGIPISVSLLALLGVSGDDPAEIAGRWQHTRGTADLASPVGADGEGPVVLDLVTDGPHILLAGTTGSGKSELLRSLVAGVAATADPEHVAIVLIDYKGGAAFDCCADLPHVAGLVTDLDDQLAARALRCLDAELRHREHRLRTVGAEDLAAFRVLVADRDDVEPLPRLLVVVDEFATLAADLPDFLHALVGVAQRGRSLGVHLVLATQRPAGVVTDDIRANAGCRIALRVTDPHDSVDVIGTPDAASIPRSRPGRAVARFGPGERVPFQSALSTGHSTTRTGVRVRGPAEAVGPDPEGPSDLRRLVDAVRRAHDDRGGRRPRSPWPPPLPSAVTRGELADPDGWLLVDEPDQQRRSISGWSIDDGHLVVVGAPGAGATTTLAAAVLAATRVGGDSAPHVHIIDLDAGGLAPLVDLAHVGTVVGPTEKERRVRLLRLLDEEIVRRRATAATPVPPDPPILLIIDDLGGLARSHDPVREQAVHERLERIWAEGPSVAVTVAASIRRSADLPPALAATVGAVLVHRTGDQGDGLRFGVRESTAGFGPGRLRRAVDGAEAQVILDRPTLTEAVEARVQDRGPSKPPLEVGQLGTVISVRSVAPSVEVGPLDAHLRIAVGDRDLGLHRLTLHRGEHAAILGPARSGRTNTLEVIARSGSEHFLVVGEGDLADRLGVVPIAPDGLVPALAEAGPTLVLVDDCLGVADPEGVLAELVTSPPPGMHFVITARADRYRSAYGHWATDVRSSRVGLLLRPEAIDGDLLGISLPTRPGLVAVPGRGVMVSDGRFEVVQTVLVDDQSVA